MGDFFLEPSKTPVLESLFDKFADPQTCNFIKKETPTQVFSCEYCEILKNNFFYRTTPVAASELDIYYNLLRTQLLSLNYGGKAKRDIPTIDFLKRFLLTLHKNEVFH